MPPNARPHTVITGGAGFIGSHLAEHLAAAGHRLTLIDDLSTGSRDNIAHLLDGNADRTPQARLIVGRASEVLRGADVDLSGASVFHLAASVGVQLVVDSPAAMMHNNLGETAAVLDACAAHRSRVLITSSSEVYGLCPEVPLHEDTPLVFGPTTASRWSYGLAKALDEHLALDLGRAGRLRPTVVRLFNTVGPRQIGRYGMVVPRFVAAAVAGEPLQVFGDGTQTRTFCDVRDVVRALARLMASDDAIGEVVNIGGSDEISIAALAEEVLTVAAEARPGAKPDKQEASPRETPAPGTRLVPYESVYGPGFEDPPQRRPATDKIRRLIGWSPAIPLRQTLRELVSAAADQEPAASSNSPTRGHLKPQAATADHAG